ncbi:peptidase S53, partial [Xanthomonas oryzae pv. oryzae]
VAGRAARQWRDRYRLDPRPAAGAPELAGGGQ